MFRGSDFVEYRLLVNIPSAVHRVYKTGGFATLQVSLQLFPPFYYLQEVSQQDRNLHRFEYISQCTEHCSPQLQGLRGTTLGSETIRLGNYAGGRYRRRLYELDSSIFISVSLVARIKGIPESGTVGLGRSWNLEKVIRPRAMNNEGKREETEGEEVVEAKERKEDRGREKKRKKPASVFIGYPDRNSRWLPGKRFVSNRCSLRGWGVVANRRKGIRATSVFRRIKEKLVNRAPGTSEPCEVMFQTRHRKTDIARLNDKKWISFIFHRRWYGYELQFVPRPGRHVFLDIAGNFKVFIHKLV